MADAGLRFDLRLDASGVAMELVAPCAFGPARLEALTVSLGRVPGPLDLREGPWALRNRRSRLQGLRLAFPYAAMIAHAAERGVDLEVRPDVGSGLLHVAEGGGGDGFTLLPVANGVDLLLVPVAAGDGAELAPAEVPRLSAFVHRAASLGEEVGGAAVRLARVVPLALREAFATRGYRVPRVGILPTVAFVDARAMTLAVGDGLDALSLPPGLAARISDIASLIERSADEATAAALRDASERLETDAREHPPTA